MENLEKQVEQLIAKAVSSEKAGDALQFSQAALNAAHTKHALAELKG